MVYLPKIWLISTVNVGCNIPYIEYLGIPMPIPTDCFRYFFTVVDAGIGNMGPKRDSLLDKHTGHFPPNHHYGQRGNKPLGSPQNQSFLGK